MRRRRRSLARISIMFCLCSASPADTIRRSIPGLSLADPFVLGGRGTPTDSGSPHRCSNAQRKRYNHPEEREDGDERADNHSRPQKIENVTQGKISRDAENGDDRGKNDGESKRKSDSPFPFPRAAMIPFRCPGEIFLVALADVPLTPHRPPRVRLSWMQMLGYVASAFVAEIYICPLGEQTRRKLDSGTRIQVQAGHVLQAAFRS